MTNFEKAVAYVNYCEKHGYLCDIRYNVRMEWFIVYTAGGFKVDYFYSAGGLYEWLAHRYDDEREAGNL